jgi:hypothetical protein
LTYIDESTQYVVLPFIPAFLRVKPHNVFVIVDDKVEEETSGHRFEFGVVNTPVAGGQKVS